MALRAVTSRRSFCSLSSVSHLLSARSPASAFLSPPAELAPAGGLRRFLAAVCLASCAEAGSGGLHRGFASETLVPRDHEVGLADVPSMAAALKNPTSKIIYDEYNHECFPPGDPSKRAFAYFVLTGGRFIYASLLTLMILKFVLSMSASKDVLALDSLEVDLSSIEPGSTVTVKWRGKPVFIRRRTEDINLANSVDITSRRDPREDSARVKNPEWLVVVAFLCPMLETLVAGFAHATDHITTALAESARVQHHSTWKCPPTHSWKRTKLLIG